MRGRGFGLIEVAIAIIIVGVGVAAIMEFMISASQTNSRLGDMTTGMALASSAMEYATDQGYTEVEKWLTNAPAFPGGSNTYLAGATGEGLEKQGWKQTFTAQRVRLADLRAASANAADTCIRVNVQVSRKIGNKDTVVYTASRWFTAAPTP